MSRSARSGWRSEAGIIGPMSSLLDDLQPQVRVAHAAHARDRRAHHGSRAGARLDDSAGPSAMAGRSGPRSAAPGRTDRAGGLGLRTRGRRGTDATRTLCDPRPAHGLPAPRGPPASTCTATRTATAHAQRGIRARRGLAGRADQPIAAAQASFMLSTPAGSRQSQPATPDAASKAAPDAAPAPAQDAEAGIWTPPAASEPVLPGSRDPVRRVPRHSRGARGRATDLPAAVPREADRQSHLPALHGGVVAGFAETAATLHLIRTLQGTKFPKSIDFSIDYLRAGRPEETFAACEVVRVGARRGAGAGALLAEAPRPADRRGPRALPAHRAGRFRGARRC